MLLPFAVTEDQYAFVFGLIDRNPPAFGSLHEAATTGSGRRLSANSRRRVSVPSKSKGRS